MSKIAIFLCVALFAAAANASFISDELESAQRGIDNVVSSAINQVRAKFEAAKATADEKLSKLQGAAQSINQKLSDYVGSLLEKTKDDVKKALERSNGKDVSECGLLLKEVDNVGVQIYSRISDCYLAKIRVGVSYVDNMKKTTDNVIADLNALRDEGGHCGKNVTDSKSALRAIFCVKLVALKASWTAAKAVPSVAINLGKLSFLLGTLQPSLAYCSKTQAFAVLARESSSIVQKAAVCVKGKVSEVTKKPVDQPTVATTESSATSSDDIGVKSVTFNDEVASSTAAAPEVKPDVAPSDSE